MLKLIFYRLHNIICVCLISVNVYSHNDLPSNKKARSIPIEITSDRANFNDKEGIAHYRGHVKMYQGAYTLQCDYLKIKRNKLNKIEQIMATGSPAYFEDKQVKPNNNAIKGYAEIIIYTPLNEKIILKNNAQLINDNNSIQGYKLIYDFKTKRLESVAKKNHRTKVVIDSKSLS